MCKGNFVRWHHVAASPHDQPFRVHEPALKPRILFGNPFFAQGPDKEFADARGQLPPAPKNESFCSLIGTPVSRVAAKRPASATDAVPDVVVETADPVPPLAQLMESVMVSKILKLDQAPREDLRLAWMNSSRNAS